MIKVESMPVNKLYSHVDDQNGEIVAAENPIKLKMRIDWCLTIKQVYSNKGIKEEREGNN